jgi:ADP-heptose:LPS heptosyltransferase
MKYPKLYLHDGGGVGDILRCQLTKKRGWGYIESFKKKFPNIYIKAIITSCNPQGYELVKHCPLFDEIQTFQWKHPHQKWPDRKKYAEKLGFVSIAEAAKEILTDVKPKIVPIWLSKQDKEVVNNIKAQGLYCFIHPWSGESWRIPCPPDKYKYLIDRIIDELKCNVVIVGGSYRKDYPKGHTFSQRLVKEEFNYERDGLFNLVNKTNIRISAQLARDAKLAVTTWSCYARSSWYNNGHTVMLHPAAFKPPQPNKERNKLISIPKKENKNRKPWKSYADQAFNWLKKGM